MNKIFVGGLFVFILSACSFPNKKHDLYYWGNYNQTVYESVQGNLSLEDQISRIRLYIDKAKLGKYKLPPGVYTHLGMLYEQSGQLDLAKEMFLEEKKTFPEATGFIDFLSKKENNKGSVK